MLISLLYSLWDMKIWNPVPTLFSCDLEQIISLNTTLPSLYSKKVREDDSSRSLGFQKNLWSYNGKKISKITVITWDPTILFWVVERGGMQCKKYGTGTNNRVQYFYFNLWCVSLLPFITLQLLWSVRYYRDNSRVWLFALNYCWDRRNHKINICYL